MKIKYHRKFDKAYKKLPAGLKKKTKQALRRFIQNPTHPSLRNHALTGRMKGLRAFWITEKVRVIFEERDGYILVTFLDVGGHDEVYR